MKRILPVICILISAVVILSACGRGSRNAEDGDRQNEPPDTGVLHNQQDDNIRTLTIRTSDIHTDVVTQISPGMFSVSRFVSRLHCR